MNVERMEISEWNKWKPIRSCFQRLDMRASIVWIYVCICMDWYNYVLVLTVYMYSVACWRRQETANLSLKISDRQLNHVGEFLTKNSIEKEKKVDRVRIMKSISEIKREYISVKEERESLAMRHRRSIDSSIFS